MEWVDPSAEVVHSATLESYSIFILHIFLLHICVEMSYRR